jgi:hypothetical protein
MQLTLQIQSDHLMVTVLNPASREIKLWELENSWGWNSFAFELRSESGGQVFTIKRATRDWTKNGPTYFVLAPGEGRDLRFHIDDGWWETGDLSALKNKAIEVRAGLNIGPSPEAEQYGIFVGTVFSAWAASTPPHGWLPKGYNK